MSASLSLFDAADGIFVPAAAAATAAAAAAAAIVAAPWQ